MRHAGAGDSACRASSPRRAVYATLLIAVALALGIPVSSSLVTAAASGMPCSPASGPSPVCSSHTSYVAARLLGATWTNVSASSKDTPPLDYWASMALDFTDRQLVLFGGCGNLRCPEPAQTWTFAHGLWTNVTTNRVQPPQRSYASLDYDSVDGYVLLFGGVGRTAVLGDTWRFSDGNWTNLTGNTRRAPPARWGASMAYDPVDRGVLLFGGTTAAGSVLNDTWFYSKGVWQNVTPQVSPPPRFEASMAWDAGGSEAVLVGGCGPTTCPLGDAWSYRNGGWSPLAAGAGGLPPPRTLAALSYDAASGDLVLFGGIRNDTSLGDLWTYAAGGWARMSAPSAPTAREGSAVLESTEVWSPQGTPVVWPYLSLWGGDSVACPTCALQGLADTWVYEPALHAALKPATAPPVAGTEAALRAEATGGTRPFAFRWTYGDGAAATGGPNTTHTFAAAGMYDVIVVVVDDAGATANATLLVPVTAAPLGFGALEATGVAVVAGGCCVAGALWARRRRRPPTT